MLLLSCSKDNDPIYPELKYDCFLGSCIQTEDGLFSSYNSCFDISNELELEFEPE